jgi:hypothetical protein
MSIESSPDKTARIEEIYQEFKPMGGVVRAKQLLKELEALEYLNQG